jgi:hypothetical protein
MLVDRRVYDVALGRLHREDLNPFPIQEQLDLVRLAQPFDILVAIPGQTNLELVLAVHREGVGEDRAAASADGEAVQVTFLGQVGRDPDRVAARRSSRPAYGEAADLLGCRDIAIEQGGGEIANGDVVEPVAGLVRGQQRGDVDVHGQQIAHRVLVLRPREPADRRVAPRVGVRGRGAVERSLQVGNHRVIGPIVRAVFADRRHLPRAELAHDLLPHLGMAGHVVRRNRVEREAGLLVVLVMTRQAVLVDDREQMDGGLRRRRGARLRRLRVERQREAAGRDEPRHADGD